MNMDATWDGNLLLTGHLEQGEVGKVVVSSKSDDSFGGKGDTP